MITEFRFHTKRLNNVRMTSNSVYTVDQLFQFEDALLFLLSLITTFCANYFQNC